MRARIYKPSKSTMQSGRGKDTRWILECDARTAKTVEPLMGWTSAGDTDDQIKMFFESKDTAITFAEKNNWKYTVLKEQTRIVRPRSYADNFKFEPAE